MRMQMIFRDAVSNRRDASKAFWETQNVGQDDPAQVMLGLGLVEASRGEVEGERMADVLMGVHAGGLYLRFAGSAYDPGFYRAGENDLPGLGTEIRTRPPAGWSPELAFGSFYMRETRFPAAAGCVVHAALGLVVVRRNSLAERVMFDLEGRGGLLAQTSTSPEPEAFELGSAIGQTFGAPIWGWNGPKRAILSTLTLETIDGMARIRTLEGLPALTREQETELALLNRGRPETSCAAAVPIPSFGAFRSSPAGWASMSSWRSHLTTTPSPRRSHGATRRSRPPCAASSSARTSFPVRHEWGEGRLSAQAVGPGDGRGRG